MSQHIPEQSVLISGLGQSAIARMQTRSELQLTIDAIMSAVHDAGLSLDDVDGIATAPGPGAEVVVGFKGPDHADVQQALGLSTSWQLGGILALYEAILAVAAGAARHVVVYRTITEGRMSKREGGRPAMGSTWPSAQGLFEWSFPVGAVSAVNWAAMHARVHMRKYGVTREQLGGLVTTQRSYAALNPDAVYKEPLSLEQYLAGRPISTPLCLYDCDVPVDVSTAFVLSSVSTRHDLRSPVRIEAISTALSDRTIWPQWDDYSTTQAHVCAARLWSRTTVKPGDVDVAQMYDGFSYLAMMWLEALGLCGEGESGAFVEGGIRIGLSGELPVNTFGGQLSAGRIHMGFGHVAEAVRQLRGDAGARQRAGADVAATSFGGGAGPHGCMILTSMR